MTENERTQSEILKKCAVLTHLCCHLAVGCASTDENAMP